MARTECDQNTSPFTDADDVALTDACTRRYTTANGDDHAYTTSVSDCHRDCDAVTHSYPRDTASTADSDNDGDSHLNTCFGSGSSLEHRDAAAHSYFLPDFRLADPHGGVPKRDTRIADRDPNANQDANTHSNSNPESHRDKNADAYDHTDTAATHRGGNRPDGNTIDRDSNGRTDCYANSDGPLADYPGGDTSYVGTIGCGANHVRLG